MIGETYILENFESALENGHIKAYFQPMLRSFTGEVCCVETLARWEDPINGVLSPAEFIGTLEKHRLIYKHDLAMLESVCRHYAGTVSAGKLPVPYSVNLSRLDFDEPDIFERITGILGKYDVPASAVHLEVTESVLLDHAEGFRKTFDRFHNAGFRIWMDDFGSGFASLNVLKDYDFDLIKIDMMFLSSMNERARTIISSVVSMAKSLGIHTLAEGVETAEQVDFLRGIGCELLQGYFYAKPMSTGELEQYLNAEDVKAEKETDRAYLNNIGLLNVLSGDPIGDYSRNRNKAVGSQSASRKSQYPLALLEFREGIFTFVYANDEYIAEVKQLGFYDLSDAEKQINNSSKPFYSGTIKQMNESEKLGHAVRKNYVIGDIYYSLTLMSIAKTDDKIMLALNIRVFCSDGIEDRFEEINRYSRALFYNFDLVNILDPDRDRSRQIYSNLPFDTVYGFIPLRAGIKEFAANEIHIYDRDRYLAFMNFDTLDQRIDKDECSFVQQPFRVRIPDDKYVWKLIRITRIPTSELSCYMFSMQRMTPADIRLVSEQLP